MQNFGKWIGIIARNSRIYYQHTLEKFGINGGEYIFILYICEREGMSQDHLAEELFMNKSTVARVLDALEKKGMAIRKRNQQDKRVYNIYPTARAREIYPKICDVLTEWNQKLVEGLSDQERESVEGLLIKMTKNALGHARNEEKEDE